MEIAHEPVVSALEDILENVSPIQDSSKTLGSPRAQAHGISSQEDVIRPLNIKRDIELNKILKLPGFHISHAIFG
jgi:hypothetical protein